ncbi:MAG: sigma-E processing peptidase SpoIIGA [Bacillota bacterium]
MVIYLDITLINNFLMTFAILWAVANIMELKIYWKRLFFSGILANLYFLVFIILQIGFNNVLFSFIVHIIINILFAILMVKVAYPGLKKKNFIKAVAFLYITTFITMGTTLSIFYIYGSSPSNQRVITGMITGFIVLIILSNFAYVLFKKYTSPDVLFFDLEIFFDHKKLTLTGLVDTGNSLVDPLTKTPVIVVNIDDIKYLFPDKIRNKMLNLKDNFYQAFDIFNEYGYGDKVRILPFSDLGIENGILFGFRPDKIILKYNSNEIIVERSIIGLSKRRLDNNNDYQALIHPKLIEVEF